MAIAMGCCLGAISTITVFWLGLVVAGISGGIWVFIKKGNRHMRMPLYPFILLAFIVFIVLEGAVI